MRTIVLLLAVLVLCAIGPPSWAYYDPFEGYGGYNFEMKLGNYDEGTLYFNLTPGLTYNQAALDALPIWDGVSAQPVGAHKLLPTGSPVPTGGSTVSLEDTWGIVKLYDITLTSGPYKNQTIWNHESSGWEITGLFYHEKDAEVTQNPFNGEFSVYGNNLYAVFFAEPISGSYADWQTDPNPRAWESATDPAARGTDGSGNPLPEMPGVTESKDSTGWKQDGVGTDPVPLWTFRSVLGDPGAKSGYTGTQFEYYSEYSTNGSGTITSGNGGALASTWTDPYWGEGAGNGQWSMHPQSTPALPYNAKLSFSLDAPGDGILWTVSSEDPITGKVTPELSSATLMLVGLVPIGIIGWKRRKK